MSAIFGILRFDGAAASARDLERMGQALAHCGPDGRRTVADGPVGLGYGLMRVNREDLFEAQPLYDRGANVMLVADLRIDNREALAAIFGIAAAELAEMPDSALLLRAYAKWGEACAEHLLGDFAFAIWDAARRKLVLGRDHMGQRHVFYHRSAGFFAFATEIKGLWAAADVPRVLLEDKFVHDMVFHDEDGAGTTDFEGIEAVTGGSVLTVSADGTVASRRYWEPHADPAHENRDEAYYVETYRTVLEEAVACRLRRSLAPAGLFMGGGFDSSAICALAGPVVKAQGRKLIAVSSVMPEDYRGTIRHARRWVEICRRHMPHLDVRYVTREGIDVLAGMEKSFLATDSRHSPNRYANDALYAVIAAAGARIVMDGHGGDYTLNPSGNDALALFLLKGQFRRFVAEFGAMRRHRQASRRGILGRFVLWPLLPAAWRNVWVRRQTGLKLFGTILPVSRQVIERGPGNASARFAYRPGRDRRASMARVLRRLQDNPELSGSIAAAVHGLQFTQPFHDKRVVEFGLAIPEDLFVKNGRARHLARQALKDWYPPEFQTRPQRNDDREPDFLLMAKRIEPRLLAEIDRMEKVGYLSRYFDFPRMRTMLTQRAAEQHLSGNEFDTRQAVAAFLAARYIEWFRRANTA